MYSNYAGYIILIPADIFKNTSKGTFHVYRWGADKPPHANGKDIEDAGRPKLK